jgi:hypothetical protein
MSEYLSVSEIKAADKIDTKKINKSVFLGISEIQDRFKQHQNFSGIPTESIKKYLMLWRSDEFCITLEKKFR